MLLGESTFGIKHPDAIKKQAYVIFSQPPT